MERQRHLRASHRIGAVHMHGDSPGVDTQIVDLAASGIQIVIDGVGNIDRVRGGSAVGHQLQPGGIYGAVAGQGLAIGSDLGGDFGQHGNALVRLDYAGGDGIEMLQVNVAFSGVSEASFWFTGPALPFTSSKPPPGRLAESTKGKDLAKENCSADRFRLL